MNNYKYLKPIKRSKLRLFLGKKYYILHRHIKWYLGNKKYSKIKYNKNLNNVWINHKTPIYRKLRNVDMWLQENKENNLRIAIKRINGILIKPGETFSYWKTIGKPTKNKGYKKGMNLFYGNFRAETGGGLCQLSNMLYWMSLHTPLTVTERYRHSYDVFPDSNRTQPFGSGATCVYNYRDLQVFNGTNETYQIVLKIENNYLVGEIRSDITPYFKYRVYEKDHKITHEYWGAYIRHNIIRREVLEFNNNKVDDEFICENHALMMYEPLIS